MIVSLIVALGVSLAIATLLIRFAHVHARFTQDNANGVQKFHARPTPRVGGIPLFAGLGAALVSASMAGAVAPSVAGWLVLSALPVFVAGLAEDVTRRVGPAWRLLAAFASAALAMWLFGTVLGRFDLPPVDALVGAFPILAVAITMFAVGGVCHAMNIIDGYNGLSGVVAAMILAALGYVAWKVGDYELFVISGGAIGAIIGFLIWNYPRGLIFAGDGGAYLLGFLIAEISVLLVARHPQVSAWFPLLLVGYPVWETMFSIYRKKFVRGQSPGIPDGLHFHMLIYKRLVRWMVGNRDADVVLKRNSMTSPYLWAVAAITVVPAVLFWNNTLALQVAFPLFAISYVWLYLRIVRFRTPKLLVIGRKSPKGGGTPPKAFKIQGRRRSGTG